MKSEIDIPSLRAVLAAATPGPWLADLDVFDSEDGIVACVTNDEVSLLVQIETGLLISGPDDGSWTGEDSKRRDEMWSRAREGQELRDARFIATARTALPQALDRIEVLERLLGEACKFIEEDARRSGSSMAEMVNEDAKHSTSPTCRAEGHVWRIKNERGHDNVHCARCYQCLGVDSMLAAYIEKHGGRKWP